MSMNKSALCPLDGRYGEKLGTLRNVMSEAAFAVSRLRGECAWFSLLSTLWLLPLGVVLAAMIIWAHRSNIGRLMRGEESKFVLKK